LPTPPGGVRSTSVTGTAPDLPEPPPGVELRDPEDADALRADIDRDLVAAMNRYVNGYAYGGVRLELKNVRMTDKDRFSLSEQQEAKLADRLLHRRMRGDVRLVDDETGELLEERKNLTLARVPWLTQRGTFVNNGSEFSPIMQSRLLPGAYTRRRDSGQLETHFNTRPGTGPAMRVTFDPSTAQYRIKVGSSDLHAYSVFHDMGVTDEELERRWGSEILEANRAKYSGRTLERLYKKAVPKWERDETLPVTEKVQAIRDALQRAQVADKLMRRDLPNLYSAEKAAHWRAAGRAVDQAQKMVKEASRRFAPDLSPEAVMDQWLEFDFDFEKAAAEFEPDLSPDEMKESYNSVYGRVGPRLASMRRWPAHWLDDENNQGWLQWYQKYSDGHRSDTDEKQKARWKSFKSRHGAQFVTNPTPRRAYALMNWGIDPLKLLPDDKAEAVKEEMDAYRRKEYVKWYMNRHDFDDSQRHRLGVLAVSRGHSFDLNGDDPDDRVLMDMALGGYIQPEDLK